MLIQALYIKALFKLTFLNSNKNNSMKTYFNAACLKWFFGEKNLHTHTQKWFKLTALRWWSLSDRCSTPAFTDTMMLLLRLRLSSAWDLLSSSFWRWLWNSSSILSPLTKQNKHMQSCTNTCIANRPVPLIIFKEPSGLCEEAMYNLESLAWPVYWPSESGMTCVLTLTVWHRRCTSSPQTPSGVSPCPPSAVWSVSRCPSVALPGAWSFRPDPQIVAPLPVMQTILFSKSDLLSSKY